MKFVISSPSHALSSWYLYLSRARSLALPIQRRFCTSPPTSYITGTHTHTRTHTNIHTHAHIRPNAQATANVRSVTNTHTGTRMSLATACFHSVHTCSEDDSNGPVCRVGRRRPKKACKRCHARFPLPNHTTRRGCKIWQTPQSHPCLPAWFQRMSLFTGRAPRKETTKPKSALADFLFRSARKQPANWANHSI
jgi:hypothetical protein